MVLAPDKVEIRTQTSETKPSRTPENPVDTAETVKFIEAITGRKIRAQVKVNHAKIQAGESPVYGEPVNQHINDLNDAFRDHDFDVIAGPGLTRSNNRFYRAVLLQIRPGLTDTDKASLAGSVPSTVPLGTRIVYFEQPLLTPQLASQRRVTPNSHRLLPGEDPKLRMP